MELGYKAHIAIDAKSEPPRASIVVPANENEKKQVFGEGSTDPEKLVADSQYLGAVFINERIKKSIEPIILCPVDQRKVERRLLMGDRKFRAHGPAILRMFRKRPSIERGLLNSTSPILFTWKRSFAQRERGRSVPVNIAPTAS